MVHRHIQRDELADKTIDVHSHIGVGLRALAEIGFPYCSSVEDLYYRHLANGVDCGVVFPINADLHFDLPTLFASGRLIPAESPISKVPYERENRLLLTDVYRFCPEHTDHFLPFVSGDPGRMVKEQIAVLKDLEQEFPIYGVKIVPVLVQSSVLGLLGDGAALLEFASTRNWPILLHVTVDPLESFSQAEDTFRVIEHHPELRYCLAHCIGLHRGFLERADALPNVWVDSAALKIQVQLAREGSTVMALPPDRFDCDVSDHVAVMRSLVEAFPQTMLWGSDAPYHSYITRRLQGEGVYTEFRLKGTYEEEKAAFDGLPEEAREQIQRNARSYLFGQAR